MEGFLAPRYWTTVTTGTAIIRGGLAGKMRKLIKSRSALLTLPRLPADCLAAGDRPHASPIATVRTIEY